MGAHVDIDQKMKRTNIGKCVSSSLKKIEKRTRSDI